MLRRTLTGLGRSRIASIAIATVVVTHAYLLAREASLHSPCWDEVGHYAAGVGHWRFGRFEFYSVNPPLVRMLAVAPVTLVAPDPNWSAFDSTPGAKSEVSIGRAYFREYGEDALQYIIYARWTLIPLNIIAAYVCFCWARDLFGLASGFIALLLWCFCPNVLGYGHLITPDIGAAGLGVAAHYAFWQWLIRSTWQRALIAGTLMGLMELTKSTWVVSFAVWPLIWFVYTRRWSDWSQRRQLLTMLALGIFVLNLGYGFEGTFTKLGDFRFISHSLGGTTDGGIGNRFANHWAADLPVPLPKNYVSGMDIQKCDFELTFWSYLRGEWKKGGWWYYYVYACLVKVPLGTWLLALLAAGITILSIWRRTWNWRDELVVLLPGVVIFVLVSSQTGFNHHVRYVLPTFPFVFIWISKVGRVCESTANSQTGKAWPKWIMRALLAGALLWSMVSSLSAFPHSISYFNELVGGHKGGHWHLAASNVDWGQDLFFLKEWYDDHPDARPLYLRYDLPLVDPRIVGIEWQDVAPGPIMNRPGTPQTHNSPWAERLRKGPAPDERRQNPEVLGPFPGWYVLSVNQIHRREGDYEYFQEFEPLDWIANSMHVYHISLDEANRVRRKLGLEEIQ